MEADAVKNRLADGILSISPISLRCIFMVETDRRYRIFAFMEIL